MVITRSNPKKRETGKKGTNKQKEEEREQDERRGNAGERMRSQRDVRIWREYKERSEREV